MNWDGIKKAVHGIMSDAGSPNMSWGRWGSTVALFASVFWVSYELHLTGHMPPMDGITGYVVAPYTANKVTNAAQAIGQSMGNGPKT